MQDMALPSTTRINVLDLAPVDAEVALRAFAEAHGVPAYRGSQAAKHLWGDAPAASFDAMSDLPKPFRALLAEHFEMPRLALATEQLSSDGTRKFLLTL